MAFDDDLATFPDPDGNPLDSLVPSAPSRRRHQEMRNTQSRPGSPGPRSGISI